MSSRDPRENRRQGSTSSTSSRPPPSHMESAVTRLLVATRQLLEALTKWSEGLIAETEVSDVYVRLGNDFNAAVTAFGSLGIDMTELLSVPMDLRNCLEMALAEDPTPQNLEIYLPDIRRIIVNLLQGLKGKQGIFRQMMAAQAQQGSEEASRREVQAKEAAEARERERQRQREALSQNGERDRSSISSSGGNSLRASTGKPHRSSSESAAVPPMEFQQQQQYHDSQDPSQRSSMASFNQAPGLHRNSASFHDQSGSKRSGLGSQRPARTPVVPSKSQPAPSDAFRPSRRRIDIEAANAGSGEDRSFGAKSPSPVGSHFTSVSPPPAQQQPIRVTLTDPPMESPSPSISPKKLPMLPPTISEPPASPSQMVRHNLVDLSSPAQSFASDDASTSTLPSEYGTPSKSTPADPTLSFLRKSDLLPRRASQRYSTYQMGKILGGPDSSGKGKAGRGGTEAGLVGEVGEVLGGGSPSRPPKRASRMSSFSGGQAPPPVPTLPAGATSPGRPVSVVVEEKQDEEFVPPNVERGKLSRLSTTIDTPVSASAPYKIPNPVLSPPILSSIPFVITEAPLLDSSVTSSQTPQQQSQTATPTSQPPSPGTASPTHLTVYLQIGREVKKAIIPSHPSIPSLRLLFMEKFSYSPGLQENFPSIYVRDPKTGVQYEWEEDELADGALLNLNIEPLDQVKQHIDLQMSSLSRKFEDLLAASIAPLSRQFDTIQQRSAVNPNHRLSVSLSPQISALGVGAQLTSPSTSPFAPRPTDQQFQNVARRVLKLDPDALEEPTEATSLLNKQPVDSEKEAVNAEISAVAAEKAAKIVTDLKFQFDEVQNLRRDLGVMRQVYVDFVNQAKDTFSKVKVENQAVRDLAVAKVGGGRAFVNAGKKKLDSTSQEILTKIESLGDMVEDLASDVSKRHIVPKPAIMRSLKKDITAATEDIAQLLSLTRDSRSVWGKTWEAELTNVVEEQKFLEHQEQLTEDIKDDFTQLSSVFENIELYVAQRGGKPGSGKGRGGFILPSPTEEHGLDSVLSEIKTASIDPEKRLRAIALAQKQRQKELAESKNEDIFAGQLHDFVDGKKLKKTGGVEETERLRQKKNDLALRLANGGGAMPSPTLSQTQSPSTASTSSFSAQPNL